MKRVKTEHKNRLGMKILNSLLYMSIEGPSEEDFCPAAAVTAWASQKNRRIALWSVTVGALIDCQTVFSD